MDFNNRLTESVQSFLKIYPLIRSFIQMEIHREVCFCFGTGKNHKFLMELNQKHKFFGQIVALEQPRYIMQYKSKTKQDYINKYLQAFDQVRKD